MHYDIKQTLSDNDRMCMKFWCLTVKQNTEATTSQQEESGPHRTDPAPDDVASAANTSANQYDDYYCR